MNPRLTAIALAVLVVLGGVVWFTEFRDKGESPAAAKPSDKPDLTIFTIEEREIRRIEVARGGQTTTVDRDEQGEWTVQPSGQPGDRARLSGLMFRLASLNASRRVAEAPEDLAQFGLDQPALTATVTVADGSTHTLLVGGKAPTDTGTYVKKADDQTVFLVANQLVADLDRLVAEPPVAPPTPTPGPTSTPSAEATPTGGG